jgi:hypothetical protein
MAREVVATLVCDACKERGERVVATFSDTLVYQGVVKQVELCGEDRVLYIDNGLLYLLRIGHEPDPEEEPVPVRVSCPVPDCGMEMVKKSLSSHVRTVHGVTLTELRSGAAPYPKNELECPECERTFDTPQGLGAHRYAHHGVKGVTKPKPGPSQRRKSA